MTILIRFTQIFLDFFSQFELWLLSSLLPTKSTEKGLLMMSCTLLSHMPPALLVTSQIWSNWQHSCLFLQFSDVSFYQTTI